ncbi:MAG TPA: hypothetical protein VMH87_01150 [Pseudomonadales bacterium]|nr:hypothetical protein [Pseudomonadales bacterium]
MKLRLSKKSNQAWTITDIVVVIVVIIVLAALLLPVISAAKRHALRMKCADNLKQITLACRDWEGDNNNEYPMTISVTNGGAREMVAVGDVAHCFQVMSNELIFPKYLICPADRERVPATNFTADFNNSHISYFINPDANEMYPQEVLLGDDNLAVNGVPVKSGLLELSTNAQVTFTADRHRYVGNISYSDGSISEVSSSGLQSSFILSVQGTPKTTNCLAIP